MSLNTSKEAHSILSLSILRKLVLVVIVVVIVLAIYMLITNVDVYVLLSADTKYIALSVTLFALVNVIDAFRLMVLVKSIGHRIKFIDALRARLMGNIVALATPSSIGGEPARALILSFYGISLMKSVITTLFEDYWDIVLVNIPALVLALHKLPLSIVAVLTSTYNVVAWNILFLAPRVKKLRKLLESIHKASKGFIRNALTTILSAVTSINNVVTAVKPHRIIMSVLSLTLTKYFILTLAFYYASLSVNSKITLYKAFQALLFYNAMGVIPTPGASGGLEYGLSLVLSPEEVVVIRLLVLSTMIFLGLPLLLVFIKSLSQKLELS